ncbi:hypothetical protein ACFV2H_34080 [Streptomyces sp. NPDC059629]|uniref:hypothetical protein n=1 Tax=Streptomyces sp. NPDC059629 TaxID=3346889 RepID=UPI0036BE40BC
MTGRFTFVTPEAAEMLGADTAELIGALPGEALPWLDVPEVEDCCRRAVMSERPTFFGALRPPGTPLTFGLYPGPPGSSVRITRAGTGGDAPPEPSRTPVGPADVAVGPGRAGLLYHLMHLAGTFTEAVGVQDVVNQTADQLMPALGATAVALMAFRDGRLKILGHRGYESSLMATSTICRSRRTHPPYRCSFRAPCCPSTCRPSRI